MQYKYGSIKDKHKALQIKQRLSLLYAFIGWNCFGILFYLILKSKMPTDSTERSKLSFLLIFNSNFVRKTEKILILL